MVTLLLLATMYFNELISLGSGKQLSDVFKYYHTLNKEDFHHRIIRKSLPNEHDRNVAFISHGKTFHMKLVQSRDIFAELFQAVTVDSYGNEHPFNINMDSYYKGYVEEDETSHVTAHVEDDGLITATIDTANETYIVEPMWRHVDGNHPYDMIIYKASNLKWNMTKLVGEQRISLCGLNATAPKVDIGENETSIGNNQRRRRDTSCNEQNTNNTCNLILVGDYNFVVNIGRNNTATAINHMLITINRVDQVFRKTCWPGVGTNIGVQVNKVKVHTGYTTSGGKPRYNQQKHGGWNVNKLLREFSKSNWGAYCLAHLFTYQDFKDGVIGLASIAKTGKNGGICSRMNSYTRRCDNTGLSTYINWNRPMTTLEAYLVTAHEIGHNFGANHDDLKNKKCSPAKGGKYIMYPYSGTGWMRNHESFSSCSGEEVGRVLSKRRECFTAKGGTAFCHNSIVETGEDCDEGLNENDPCCKDCKFKHKLVNCSDHNSLCCKNCTIASTNIRCREEYSLDCQGETKCDGVSKDCPTESPKLNSSECINGFSKGECRNGRCVSLCLLNNRIPCKCTNINDACKVCCKILLSDNCTPLRITSSHINETDGALCTRAADEEGLCMSGRCRKPERDITDLLTRSDLVAYAVLLMEENIVLTILIFSLLIWIPASIIVNRWDKRDLLEVESVVSSSELYISTKSLSLNPNLNDARFL